jgi:hypothetical protein
MGGRCVRLGCSETHATGRLNVVADATDFLSTSFPILSPGKRMPELLGRERCGG